MYFITVLLAVVVLLYFRAKSRSNKYKDYEGISLFQFLSSPRQIAQKLSKIRGVKFTRLETPGFTALCAQHPETAKFIWSNPELFPKAGINSVQSVTELSKDGIILSSGEQWRRLRTTLSPPFHFDAVKQWVPDFHRLALELTEQWDQQLAQPINIVRWMPLFTLDALGVTVLSRSFNAMKGDEDKDLAAVRTILDTLGKPSTFFLGKLEMLTGMNILKELNSASHSIKKSLTQIIEAKKGKKVDGDHFDLVDVMMHADPKWSEIEVVANTFTMFIAGFETTSTALTWLFYHLATNQHVQERLINEVKQVLKGQAIQHENIKDLPYLTKVLKENLRIQPPVAFSFTRIVTEDVEYEGKIIPKGTRTGVNYYAIHHDPELWENPEEFNPDRFDKPSVPFSYVPFALKSRSCLGNQFSLIEQTVFIATVLQRFRIKSVSSHKPAIGSNPVLNQMVELKVNLEKL
jgi:cytochrome P450